MHERERHRIILSAVQERPVITIQDLMQLTSASQATLRRDIATLHAQGRIKRVRGGAEALYPPQIGLLAGRPFKVSSSEHLAAKRAIARQASKLCTQGDNIIMTSGSTVFQMVHYITEQHLQIMTPSFAIAEHLLRHSKNTIIVPGGVIYREQSMILSPFDNDVIGNFYGQRIFTGCKGVNHFGAMETDGLIIQNMLKLIAQADELVLLVDSTKFSCRSSLVLYPLKRIHTLITDEDIKDEARTMVEEAGIRLIVARMRASFAKTHEST